MHRGNGLRRDTMPEFVNLQQKAMALPARLRKAYSKYNTFGGLFCTCLPSMMNPQLLLDAQLIEQTAFCLGFYLNSQDQQDADPIKEAVLIGMYIHIWYQYDSSLGWFLNKPLLALLQEHLELESLTNLDKTTYKNSLEELGYFTHWVYENRNSYKELNHLYQAYPAEMQDRLDEQRNALECHSSWSSILSTLATQLSQRFF